MQYNKLLAVSEQINILQKDALQLEVIILEMHGIKVVPTKPPIKPYII